MRGEDSRQEKKEESPLRAVATEITRSIEIEREMERGVGHSQGIYSLSLGSTPTFVACHRAH